MPRGADAYDEARLQGGLFTPDVLRPIGWFDADDISTISVATGVSSWRNKGTVGGSVSQGTGASQPSFLRSGWNGIRNVLSFDGVNDVLFSNTTTLSWGQNQSGSFFIVYDGGSIPSTAAVIMECATSTGSLNKDIMIFSETPSSAVTIFGTGSAADSGAWLTISGRLLSTNPELLNGEIVSTGAQTGNKFFRSNGTLIGSAAYALKAVAGNRFTLGAQGNGSTGTIGAFYPGLLAEVIIFNYAVNDKQRQAVEGYLMWKWGLRSSFSTSHPYINRPPLIGD